MSEPTPTTAIEKSPPAPSTRLRLYLEQLENNESIAKVISREVTPQRIAALFIAEAARQPTLYECMETAQGRQSIVTFFMLASQLGLEPGSGLGLLYPTTRKIKGRQQIVPIVGYRGLATLARRSGEIARINAAPFYQDEIDKGLIVVSREPPDVIHRWASNVARTTETLIGAYAVVELKDGAKAVLVMDRDDIEKRRRRSPTANSEHSPWNTDYDAMARKTVLRALLNGGTVPLSTEARHAIVNDDVEPEIDPEEDDAGVATVRPETGRDAVREALGIDPDPLAPIPPEDEQPA
jgi:recombination protein RecT